MISLIPLVIGVILTSIGYSNMSNQFTRQRGRILLYFGLGLITLGCIGFVFG